jgi:hypothetical protein
VRTVKTASAATAVQIVYSSSRGSRKIEHLGSAHDDAQVEVLKAVARQRLAAGQDELDLGLDPAAAGSGGDRGGGPLSITASRMGHLWDALDHAYRLLGFEAAAGGDEVFRDLVLARIIEPTSKLDTSRVLEEVGVTAASYPTIKRRLPLYAKDSWRAALAPAYAAHAALGPAALVLYDVTTLYFETDTGDGFRESGFSKERPVRSWGRVGSVDPFGVDQHPGQRCRAAHVGARLLAKMISCGSVGYPGFRAFRWTWPSATTTCRRVCAATRGRCAERLTCRRSRPIVIDARRESRPLDHTRNACPYCRTTGPRTSWIAFWSSKLPARALLQTRHSAQPGQPVPFDKDQAKGEISWNVPIARDDAD